MSRTQRARSTETSMSLALRIPLRVLKRLDVLARAARRTRADYIRVVLAEIAERRDLVVREEPK